MLGVHPLPNKTANVIMCVVCMVLYAITFGVAYIKEDNLKSRIKTLEDRVENNAEHIYKLTKKQSDKTIEYCTDEM